MIGTFVRFLALAILAGPAAAPVVAQGFGYSGIEELNRVVAVVDDDVIVRSELDRQLQVVRAEMRSRDVREPPPAVLEQQVLDRLVLERLQMQVADRLGIRVNDDELNEAVSNIARRNRLSLTEFRNILERDGYPFADFRENIRKEMLIARVRQRQVGNRVRVRDAEIDAWLQQRGRGDAAKEYRLSHILVAIPAPGGPNEAAAAEEKARAIRQRIAEGEDFSALARRFSDASQRESAGDLGWRKTEQLPSLFAPIVPALAPGEASDVIAAASGFHIVKVEEVRDPDRARHLVHQTHARHILVQTGETTSDDDATTRLRQLRERLLQGESFGALARSHSDDRGSAVKDGDLGWLGPGDVVPAFEEVIDALGPDELSQPFRTQFGWHLVQVLERREHDDTEQVLRNEARIEIRKRKSDEELETWLRSLRDEAYVEYRLGE